MTYGTFVGLSLESKCCPFHYGKKLNDEIKSSTPYVIMSVPFGPASCYTSIGEVFMMKNNHIIFRKEENYHIIMNCGLDAQNITNTVLDGIFAREKILGRLSGLTFWIQDFRQCVDEDQTSKGILTRVTYGKVNIAPELSRS